MGYIAVIVGFVILVALCMLNVNVIFSAFTAAMAVIYLENLPITDSIINVFFGRFGVIVGTMFPMFFFGAILAKLYTYSNAASVIANKIGTTLFQYAKSKKQKCSMGFLSVIIASAILCYGGINAAVAIIAIYPIALGIFRHAGIPKRFIMGAICGGAFTFALSGPGSPQPTNVVAMHIGTSSAVGMVAGIIGAIVEIAVMVTVLSILCIKAINNGEKFEADTEDEIDVLRGKRPKFLLSLIPLLVLLIVFNVFKINISISILISSVVASIIFFPELGKKKLLLAINDGVVTSLLPAGIIAGVNGFAAVVQSVPEYQKLIDSLLTSTLPPVLMLILCIALICMMTGGSTTGTQIALPIIAPHLTAVGLTLPFIHRVGTFAATMLDSLPNSGAVIMAVNIANLKMKEAYPPVFVSTVLATTCGTIIVAIVMTLFPMLP